MSLRKKVLLIGWDAADWRDINPLLDAGKMPNVQRLVENGAMGQIATFHPPLSPMLWTSIATGKQPFKHGIHGFAEPFSPTNEWSRKRPWLLLCGYIVYKTVLRIVNVPFRAG